MTAEILQNPFPPLLRFTLKVCFSCQSPKPNTVLNTGHNLLGKSGLTANNLGVGLRGHPQQTLIQLDLLDAVFHLTNNGFLKHI